VYVAPDDDEVLAVAVVVVVSMTGPKPSSISTLTRELRSSGGSISSSSDWLELKLGMKGKSESQLLYILYTVAPRYMREIGTQKIGSHNNKFEYKKTKDYCKLADRLLKKGHFSIAYK
jgi:hypothetical protein